MHLPVVFPALILTTAFVLAPGGRAQESPFEAPIVNLTENLRFVVAGDLDHDGDTDFVAATVPNNFIVALQTAPGTWTPQPPVAVGTNFVAAALGDVNGDGRPDLAALVDGPSLDLLVVRLGDGAGGFGPAMFSTTASGPSDLDLADVNGDGKLDAVVTGNAAGRVAVHLGNGGGTFAAKVEYGAGLLPYHAAVGDWNGDLMPDLAFSNNSTVAGQRAVTIVLNSGTGTFGAPVTLVQGAQPFDIETGDFDKDGNADLAVGQATVSTLLVLLGAGDGSFEPGVLIPNLTSAHQLAVADFDEDGDSDIATTAVISGAQTLGVLLSRGDGSFDPVVRCGSIGAALDVLAQDVNGDDDIDLVAPCNEFVFAHALSVLAGNGRGAFGPLHGLLSDNSHDVDLADLDGDGRLDMVSASQLNSLVSILPGKGNGVYAAALSLDVSVTPGDGRRPQSVAIGDLDGDGLLDIVSGINTFPAEIDVFFGTGPLTFGPRVPIFVDAVPVDVHLADLDGDGLPEVLAIGSSNKTLAILRNLGGGALAAPDLYATATAPYRLDTADMNGDGLLDVVLTTGGATLASFVHVFLGNGDGTVQRVLTFAGGTNHGGLGLGDADADGDIDVAVTQAQFGSTLLLFNDGTGFLSAPVQLESNTLSGSGVAIADFDRDGVADIVALGGSVTPNDGLGSIAFLRGLGGGTFAPAQRTITSSGGNALTVADIDGDGAPDLAVPVLYDYVHVVLNRNGPWNDLHHPLAGTLGLPRQVGEGTLQDFAPFRFTLSDARPNALVAHFIGLVPLNAPFKGGLLVPAPMLITYPWLTDATGELVLQGPWPAGAGGFTLYFQFWFQDPAGPVGFAASNALSATIPLP